MYVSKLRRLGLVPFRFRPASSAMSLPLTRLVPLVLLAFVAGCKQDAQQHGKGGMPPSQVTVVVAEAKEVPVTYEHTAQTAGFREVEVRARVTGILVKRHYKEGAAVRKGDTMFT